MSNEDKRPYFASASPGSSDRLKAVEAEVPADPHEGVINTYEGGVIVDEQDEDKLTLEYTKPDGTRVIHPDWNDCAYVDAKATPLETARAVNELLSRRGADFRVVDIDDGSDTYIFITESCQ